MERRVYNYTWKVWSEIILRSLSGAAWILLWVIAPTTLYKGDDPTFASWFKIGGCCVALLGALVLLAMSLGLARLLRESITVDNGYIIYLGSDGRRIACPLTDVEGILSVDSDLEDGESKKASRIPKMYKVFTKAGVFHFYPSISNASELCDVLNRASSEHAALHPSAVVEGADV